MRLALTFDDGPSPWTESLLDVLREHGAQATFFVLGEHVRERPEVVRHAAAEGHEIGNHTWSHRRLTECEGSVVQDELRRANEAIADALGVPPRLFRAPYFAVDQRVEAAAAELGLVHVGCTVDPEDWRPEVDAATIADRVLRQAGDGEIVDLHDNRPSGDSSARADPTPTVDALRLLLPALREQGYELVTVSALSA